MCALGAPMKSDIYGFRCHLEYKSPYALLPLRFLLKSHQQGKTLLGLLITVDLV